MKLQPSLKRFAASILSRVNLSLLKQDWRINLDELALLGAKSQRLGMVADSDLRRALDLLPKSQSQLNQDFFVLSELNWKRNGYFVEFGATNGKALSNTWMLEKEFGWTGILSEPARVWRKALATSGRTASIDFDCVWSRSGETLPFVESGRAELSTIGEYVANDGHARDKARSYLVGTISLNDLLKRHGAPRVMDYLSIDTEGSEFEILRKLDFSTYRFRTITCEHNRTPARDDIHRLLCSVGYVRKFEEISEFDDWYVWDE